MIEVEGIEVLECDKCPALCESRKQIVNGRGPKDARVVIVGQAPGREEDRRGQPFIGPAGKTLYQWLEEAGIDADRDVYYTNAVRCIPPMKDNKEREPTDEEIANCHDFLLDEIDEINPDIIIPAGAVALKALYDDAHKITAMRGTVLWHDELDIKMLPILHPSAAFHTWSIEEFALSDLRKAARELKDPRHNPADDKTAYTVCLDVESVEALADELVNSEFLSFDTETTSLDWQTGHVLCVGLSDKEGTAFVVPVLGFMAEEFWSKKDKKRVIAALTRIFESDVPKIAQNGKFDLLFLKHDLGIEVLNFVFDTMLGYHLFHEEGQGQSLDALNGLFTNMGDYSKDSRPYKKDMKTCPLNMLWKYQAGDADCTFRVAMILMDWLADYPKLQWVMDNITMPMSDVVMHMEERGILVDQKLADKLVKTYDKLVEKDMQLLFGIEGVPEKFNPRSHPQKRKLLFETFGLPVSSIVTEKAKEPSVKTEALLEIGEDSHEVIPILLRLQGYNDIQKSFLTGAIPEKREANKKKKKGLLNKISKVTGHLHTDYRVDGTETGRLSATPNLQNVVGEGKVAAGAAIRAIFMARPGYALMSLDYSQMELRGLSYISNDAKLIGVLESGMDVHDFVARRLFNIPEGELVSKEDRRRAKTFNFGLGYGMTEKTISKRFGVSEEEARELLEMYMAIFEELDEYFLRCRRQVRSRGFQENIFGRRRRYWGVNTMKHFGGYKRQMGHMYRASYNFPIQSSSSDIHSLATVKIDTDQWLSDMGVLLVGSIHDSVMLEVPIDKLEEVARYAQQLMYETAKDVSGWHIPVDAEVGPRWEEITHQLTSEGVWGTKEEIAELEKAA